ncbi:MAG: porin family protein [Ferruginibacter sp.]
MKTKLMAAIAICFFAITATAQKTEIGFKAGANFATLNTEASPNPYKMKTGIHAGLLAHIHLTDKFALQPEVVYSGQGAKADSGPGEINLGYLNVPILGQYMFANGFRLETGPQAGILLSAKTKYNGVTEDVKDELKGFDFAWAFGLGYKSPMGLGVDARYNLGLSDINKDNTGGSVKNNVFQVGLFYQLK